MFNSLQLNMVRVKRGNVARNRRKKILKFAKGFKFTLIQFVTFRHQLRFFIYSKVKVWVISATEAALATKDPEIASYLIMITLVMIDCCLL